MAPTLIITNNQATNPLTLDLSQYVRLQPDQGTDPAPAGFTEKVWTRSILREGATLSYEQLQEREMLFPLALKGTVSSVTAGLAAQINQVIETPGAIASWQDAGMTQPTYFDILSGQLDIEYDFWRGAQAWTYAKLRIFSQPLGRTAGPRKYATGSGPGPLVLITPYASGGALSLGASTQAAVAGYGGKPRGASTGVFYWGSPSLAGDGPAQLLMSYATFGNTSAPSFTAVSVLPDQNYNPQPPLTPVGGTSYAASSINGVVMTTAAGVKPMFTFAPTGGVNPPLAWEGLHRILALARASTSTAVLYGVESSVIRRSVTASVAAATKYSLYDLGSVTLYGSQTPGEAAGIGASLPGGGAVDVAGVFMLPDSNTWFYDHGQYPGAQSNLALIDDRIGAQAMGGPASTAIDPTGLVGLPIAGYTRGLVPRPDPKNGLPVVAVLSVGSQPAAWPFPPLSAWVDILERTRYVLP